MTPRELGSRERFGRRDALKLMGAGAATGVVATGTGTAHTSECVYFCGCGRFTAYDSGMTLRDGKEYPVLLGKEGGGPGPADLIRDTVTAEDGTLEYTQRGNGKILAFFNPDDGDVYYNPNRCAGKVFEEHGGREETLRDEFGDNPTHPGQKGHCHPPDRSSHDH